LLKHLNIIIDINLYIQETKEDINLLYFYYIAQDIFHKEQANIAVHVTCYLIFL